MNLLEAISGSPPPLRMARGRDGEGVETIAPILSFPRTRGKGLYGGAGEVSIAVRLTRRSSLVTGLAK